ncbi:DUF6207 family protein [Streptomyces phaeochromogenes]|uniref:DUF6207 family protein n=1 Tax=Streptomyces phaeochromogenes TaxID=1923 RepID=UPI000D14FF8B
MEPINETHVAEPGLTVVEVAAADDDTALAVQELLATRWQPRQRTVQPESVASGIVGHRQSQLASRVHRVGIGPFRHCGSVTDPSPCGGRG